MGECPFDPCINSPFATRNSSLLAPAACVKIYAFKGDGDIMDRRAVEKIYGGKAGGNGYKCRQ
jgi:hypothetical protein